MCLTYFVLYIYKYILCNNQQHIGMTSIKKMIHVISYFWQRLPKIFVIFVNNKLDAQFFFSCIFISILYMFQPAMSSSSGELIVSIRHLVYVTRVDDGLVCRFE